MKKTIIKIRNHLEEVIRIKTSPSSIAIGFSIGVFFGIFPSFGIEYLIMFSIILFFKKVSKISMAVGYVLFNPLVTFPIHIVSYAIGNYILSDVPVIFVKFELLNTFFVYTRRFILGSLITATFFSVLSYTVVYYLTKKYQREIKNI